MDATAHPRLRGAGPARYWGWALVALVLAPVLALFAISLAGVSELGGSPRAFVLLANTVVVGLGTAALAVSLGVSCAWLVEMCEFPLRRPLGFLLFLPFAIPPYLQAYVWADVVDDGGWLPVGVGLRNPAGACVVMALVLFPYVYMFARAAFAQRSCNLLAASRMLGCSPWGAFFKVALPLARPAIAVGALLAFMEAINDIAIAEDYGLSTLSYHIYDVWLNRDDRQLAAAYATLLMALALVLASFEQLGRVRQRQYEISQRCICAGNAYPIDGVKALAASSFCAMVAALGFFAPVVLLVSRLIGASNGLSDDVLESLADTAALLALVIVACFLLGGGISYLRRRFGPRPLGLASRLTAVGYAFPGIVYALGAIAAAGWLAWMVESVIDVSIHWIWTTSVLVLVAALSFRYVVITAGAIDSAMTAIPPHIDAVCRNAGKSRLASLLGVHLPLMRPMLAVGLLLLMVDLVKELPLTLVLRPLGTTTLALDVYQYAADEDLGSAAAPALVLVLLATVALALVYRWVVPAWRAGLDGHQVQDTGGK